MACLGGASSLVLIYCLLLVMQPQPFWTAQFLIPTLAAMLGNTLVGVSTGLSCVAEELTQGKNASLLPLYLSLSLSLSLSLFPSHPPSLSAFLCLFVLV